VIEPDWLEWARAFAREHADAWRALEEILGLPDLMARAGKPERRNARDWAGSLSGGQRQRLALARVFASEAPCLLLDEPTTWLASGDRERIMGDLLSFRRRKPGQGAVVVSHEPGLGEFAARTLRLEEADGRRVRLDRHAEPRA
jgi:ABC-type lipoprotein export system ATPase subunit